MLKFNAHIRGVAPLLFNRFPDESDENQEGVKRKKAVATKEIQVEKSLYRDEKGKIYSPADHLIGAMIKAGSNFKLDGKKTFKDVIKGGLFIEPLKMVHINQAYTADWRSVVIPSTRGRVMKGRARMDSWELKFTITCIDDRARPQELQEILKYAGAYIGIGDYRPRYGRFEVIKWNEVK